jgi:dolichol-phosphate mannosyltransferase
MDADNTHPPTYIPALRVKLQTGFDVVTASYTTGGGSARGVPFPRRLLSRGANALLGARFHFPGIGTYTNGFRAYRVGALQQAHRRYNDRLVEETNFAGGTELFIKTVRSGARPGEIPFILDYEKRGADSKINIPKTILGYLKLLKLF